MSENRIVYRELSGLPEKYIAGACDRGICFLEWGDRRGRQDLLNEVTRRFGSAPQKGSHRLLDTLETQLAEYFAGTRQVFDIPVATAGTEFQERVWSELTRIPYGRTISYAELAQRLGQPTATRAVGTANGKNIIPILIPCHRVINADGALGGFGGGLDRKRQLLELEGAITGDLGI